MWLFNSPKFVFGCRLYNLKVLFLCLKKQVVVSALRPAFFILYLESFISRLNVIPCHDLTLSVGEPDNAAAKQGQELRSEQTAINIHEQRNSLLIFAS